MKLMTWNVENLFRPGGKHDGVTDPALYEQKIKNLAAMIADDDPDVVALQEVGDPAALDDLLARLPRMSRKPIVSTQYDHSRPIRVAALLRRGVATSDIEDLYKLPEHMVTGVPASDVPGKMIETMRRGALAFTAHIGDRSVRIIVVHLKSKLLSFSTSRFAPKDEDERARASCYALFQRATEAAAVRVWADEWLEEHGQPLVIMGDLNDGPEAATTQILTGPPDRNLQRPDKGDPWRLVNLVSLRPDGQAFSRIYQGQRELIDHIHATVDLARDNPDLHIDTTHIESIGDQPKTRRTAVWPDHAPLVARFA